MADLPNRQDFGDYGEWPGRAVLDSNGERLGEVREIYLDQSTARPEWVLVLIEGGGRYVPLAGASVEGDSLRVAFAHEQVRSAPDFGGDKRIDQDEERTLYGHYGVAYSESDSSSGLPDPDAPVGDTAPVGDAPTEVRDELAGREAEEVRTEDPELPGEEPQPVPGSVALGGGAAAGGVVIAGPGEGTGDVDGDGVAETTVGTGTSGAEIDRGEAREDLAAVGDDDVARAAQSAPATAETTPPVTQGTPLEPVEPTWTTPEPETSGSGGGFGAAARSRPVQIATAGAGAVLLLVLLRRLRS